MLLLYKIYLRAIALFPAGIIFTIAKRDSVSYIPDSLYSALPIAVAIGVAGFVATCFSLYIANKLDITDGIPKGSVVEIESASNDFLPSYLGYFFVALSAPNVEGFVVTFAIITIFLILAKGAYFNPIYFIFGYNFYYIKTTDNIKKMIISKKRLTLPCDIEINELRRIDDFTLIDLMK